MHGYAQPVALQPHYSLVHRRTFETRLADISRDAGLTVLPYRALGGDSSPASTARWTTRKGARGERVCGRC